MSGKTPYTTATDSDAERSPRRIVFLTKNTSAKVVGERPRQLMSYPHLVLREMMVLLVLIIVLAALALFWDAPLEQLANPLLTPNPAKAPWYFLGLQELVAYSAFWGGVVVPGLLVTALIALPYLDRRRRGVGVWFSKERKVALTIFSVCLGTAVILTVIGTAFRGPNWGFQLPWKPIHVEEHSGP